MALRRAREAGNQTRGREQGGEVSQLWTNSSAELARNRVFRQACSGPKAKRIDSRRSPPSKEKGTKGGYSHPPDTDSKRRKVNSLISFPHGTERSTLNAGQV